jgi:uncharacterized iron-regulated membrane protein
MCALDGTPSSINTAVQPKGISGLVRTLLLNVHLYIGLAVAAVLLVLGITGTILAFSDHYDQWLHPALWHVVPQAQRLTEDRLVRSVEAHVSPARVTAIDFHENDEPQVLTLTDRSSVLVNPYTGAILARRGSNSTARAIVNFSTDLHTRLASGFVGRRIVFWVTTATLLMVPIGFYLWLKGRQLTLGRTGSWRRFNWNLHNVAGLYASVALLLLAASGYFIADESSLYQVTGTTPARVGQQPESQPSGSATAVAPTLDSVLRAADTALPGFATVRIVLPQMDTETYVVRKRVSPFVAGTATSTVYVDRFTAKPIVVDDLRSSASGYRAYRLNLAVHTGEILGLPGQILAAISGLCLVLLTVTGVIIGFRQVARHWASLRRVVSLRRRTT